MRAIGAFLWRDLTHETSYRLSFALQLLSVIPVMLMFYFLSHLVSPAVSGPLDRYGGSYFPFVIIGIALQSYLVFALSSFSESIRDSQLTGSLEAVMATPVSLGAYLAGSTAYSFLLNSLRVVIYLACGSLLFGVTLHWTRLPLVLLVLILTVASVASFGIISASFIVLFKKGDPLNWAFSVSSWLIGGVYYPVSVLPEWLQKAALLLPVTHSLESLRQVLLCDQGLPAIWEHLAILALWSAVGIPLSFCCFRYALRHAMSAGTLGHH